MSGTIGEIFERGAAMIDAAAAHSRITRMQSWLHAFGGLAKRHPDRTSFTMAEIEAEARAPTPTAKANPADTTPSAEPSTPPSTPQG